MAFSPPALERTNCNCGYFLWTHPNSVKCSSVWLVSEDSRWVSQFLWMAFFGPKSRFESSLGACSHSRNWAESRCDDNRPHLKPLAPQEPDCLVSSEFTMWGLLCFSLIGSSSCLVSYSGLYSPDFSRVMLTGDLLGAHSLSHPRAQMLPAFGRAN